MFGRTKTWEALLKNEKREGSGYGLTGMVGRAHVLGYPRVWGLERQENWVTGANVRNLKLFSNGLLKALNLYN